MATVMTLNKTGREIMNAVKAGKPVMVHCVAPNGIEIYAPPTEIAFSEANDFLGMTVYMNGATFQLEGGLDEQPSSSGSTPK